MNHKLLEMNFLNTIFTILLLCIMFLSCNDFQDTKKEFPRIKMERNLSTEELFLLDVKLDANNSLVIAYDTLKCLFFNKNIEIGNFNSILNTFILNQDKKSNYPNNPSDVVIFIRARSYENHKKNYSIVLDIEQKIQEVFLEIKNNYSIKKKQAEYSELSEDERKKVDSIFSMKVSSDKFVNLEDPFRGLIIKD